MQFTPFDSYMVGLAKPHPKKAPTTKIWQFSMIENNKKYIGLKVKKKHQKIQYIVYALTSFQKWAFSIVSIIAC